MYCQIDSKKHSGWVPCRLRRGCSTCRGLNAAPAADADAADAAAADADADAADAAAAAATDAADADDADADAADANAYAAGVAGAAAAGVAASAARDAADTHAAAAGAAYTAAATAAAAAAAYGAAAIVDADTCFSCCYCSYRCCCCYCNWYCCCCCSYCCCCCCSYCCCYCCCCCCCCRYGPPPAYPRLRLPGLNAPIPAGCSYGYQPGGWGRPPVDEGGRLLFRLDEETDEAEETAELQQDAPDAANDVLWGELPPDADAPQEEEEEQGWHPQTLNPKP